jgi:hypothetical protein
MSVPPSGEQVSLLKAEHVHGVEHTTNILCGQVGLVRREGPPMAASGLAASGRPNWEADLPVLSGSMSAFDPLRTLSGGYFLGPLTSGFLPRHPRG